MGQRLLQEGVAFVAPLAIYIFIAFQQERTTPPDYGAAFDKAEAAQGLDPGLRPEEKARHASLVSGLAISFAGLGLVVAGRMFLVDGAVALARAYNISETIIGLT